MALLVVGCGDDSDPATADAGIDGSNGPSPTLALSTVIPGTPRTGSLLFVDSFGAGTEVDQSMGLEIPGGGIAVAGPTPGTFFTTNGQAPVITRWRFAEDGTVMQDGELSFAGFSVDASRAGAGNFVFTSPTRGYILDTLSLEMVLWNPEAMVIDGSQSLDALGISGWFGLANRGVLRGTDYVVPVAYAQFTGSINELSRLLVLDINSETISRTVDIDCEGVTYVRVLEDGTLYAASDTASVTNRLAGLSDGEECYVRMGPGSYDIAERVLFSSRTGGTDAAGMFGGEGTEVFIRVLDSSLVPTQPSSVGQLNSTRMWRWARLDLAGTEDAIGFPDLEPFSTSQVTFTIDDTIWVVAPGADFSGGRLFDVSGERPVGGIAASGLIVNGFRPR
ncbi:MAG: hypothetical protein AAGF12_27110 [Myxococcota bacterium]